MKKLFIAEKPSVATEFANALDIKVKRGNGYIEDENYIVTWCVGHLVTMSYPSSYDEKYKRWSLDTLPFLPNEFKYELIDGVKKQFFIVKDLLNRTDVSHIYICTDSGREGEYIYRLVDMMAGVKDKIRLRVWIDSQTREEILRGIKEAKDWSFYDNLGASAYLRAKEDYLMGINFSRLLTLKYGRNIANIMGLDKAVLSVGRVMTCVLGMVVRREREIRNFVKTPFYRVIVNIEENNFTIEAEYKAVEGSRYFNSSFLYKENGFKEEKTAKQFIVDLKEYLKNGGRAKVYKIENKKELKNPPLLYNLAELQNDCSKMFKISPDECLKVVQDLYEAKLVTYPRTDARVLSSAVAKEISKNINGLSSLTEFSKICEYIVNGEKHKNISKSKYVNDKLITDHYAIIPTGSGISSFNRLSSLHKSIYNLICKRFLSVFLPAAEYKKYNLDIEIDGEHFFATYKVCINEGYLYLYRKKEDKIEDTEKDAEYEQDKDIDNKDFVEIISKIKKGKSLEVKDFTIKEGETSPPKRYSSGSMILAMENAGQLIEDEDLRATIKGSGIGTSATRAEILKKLFSIDYLKLNKKTQIISPSLFGEMVYEAVFLSIKQLLNPELTASWEKGLTYVWEGSISSEEYMLKLENFVSLRTNKVKNINNAYMLREIYIGIKDLYKPEKKLKPKKE